MEKITLEVDGMSCTSCSVGIVKTLESMGLQEVKGNYAAGEIAFKARSKKDIKKAVDTINVMGYKTQAPADEHKHSKNEHNHGHDHSKHASATERSFWITVPFTGLLLLSMVFPHSFLMNPVFQLVLCLPVYFTGLRVFGRSAIKSLNIGVPNMDVLIFTGSSAAFFYSLGCMVIFWKSPEIHNYLFFETAASIITLVMLGNLIEHNSTRKTSAALQDLKALVPEKVTVLEETDGIESWIEIKTSQLKKGRKVQIAEGGHIPCDGIITKGEGQANEASLTGESLPRRLKVGDTVYAGTILFAGNLVVQAEKNYSESSLSHIINLVKEAQMNPPTIQRIGDKVSSWFVPTVVFISVMTFIAAFFVFRVDFRDSVLRSIAILVISCPCAMGLATPTAVMVGIGRAAKSGILFRSGDVLEKFAQSKVIIFDKTGTLTEGNLQINEVKTFGNVSKDQALDFAAGLSTVSSHPLSKAVVKSFKGENYSFKEVTEHKGEGIGGTDKEGNIFRLGSAGFVGTKVGNEDVPVVYLSKNKELIASIFFQDVVRKGAKETIEFFKKNGFKPILLSGDREPVCRRIAAELGISEVHHSQSPISKQQFVVNLSQTQKVVMIGDGINDSSALASALVGISHAEASSIAVNSAGIIITANNFMEKLQESFLLSKATLLTIKQNLFWAFCYNIIAIPVAGLGFLSPIVGTASMAFSDLMVIGNSLLLKKKTLK